MNCKKLLMIDAFSTLHVGNGALLDNTYNLCEKYFCKEIEIITIDILTNKGRFPTVLEDIFTDYGGSSWRKLLFSINLFIFFIFEYLNIKLFFDRIRLPWRKRFSDFINAVDRADICVSLSGETINDHYYPMMYMRLLTYYLAILKRKKFILFPQSIGPIYRPLSKFLLRKLLCDAHTIMARDKLSLKVANNLWQGKNVKVVFCPDVAVTQRSEPVVLEGIRQDKKVIGLTVSDIPKAEMGYSGNYLESLLNKLASVFDKNLYQFLLMPSNYENVGFSTDYLMCLKAKKILKLKGFEVNILPNKTIYPDTYQGMQQNLFMFISTRMHVGILASSAGVPTIMINTQHKIRAYMELIDMGRYVVDLNNLDSITDKIIELIQNNDEVRIILNNKNEDIQKEVHKTISSLANEICGE